MKKNTAQVMSINQLSSWLHTFIGDRDFWITAEEMTRENAGHRLALTASMTNEYKLCPPIHMEAEAMQQDVEAFASQAFPWAVLSAEHISGIIRETLQEALDHIDHCMPGADALKALSQDFLDEWNYSPAIDKTIHELYLGSNNDASLHEHWMQEAQALVYTVLLGAKAVRSQYAAQKMCAVIEMMMEVEYGEDIEDLLLARELVEKRASASKKECLEAVKALKDDGNCLC